MGYALQKTDEPEPFELEVQFDGDGGGPSGWSDAEILIWLRESLDLAGCDEMWNRVHAEKEKRGLKLY